jgi:hypothetical protein
MKNKAIIALFIILSVILISVLFFTKSPDQYLSKVSLFGDLYKNTSLTITSPNSINDVKIDGKEYGVTPLEIEDLEEGQHEIELVRSTNGESFYSPLKLQLDLKRNTEAIVDFEIGPAGTLSGYAIYYTQSPSTTEGIGYLTVTSSPSEATFTINNDQTYQLPIDILELKAGEYNISVNSKGYESIVVPVIIREGYNLNLRADLFPIPTNLELPQETE